MKKINSILVKFIGYPSRYAAWKGGNKILILMGITKKPLAQKGSWTPETPKLPKEEHAKWQGKLSFL